MTSTGFDEAWAETTVRQLAEQGTEFAAGLSAADIDAISAAFGTSVPPELGLLLQAAVPVSPKWAPWLDGAEDVAADAKQWIHRAFAFDIEHGDYWHPSFGTKPADLSSAITQALSVVDDAPWVCSGPGAGR